MKRCSLCDNYLDKNELCRYIMCSNYSKSSVKEVEVSYKTMFYDVSKKLDELNRENSELKIVLEHYRNIVDGAIRK